jgi:hypothetical protein
MCNFFTGLMQCGRLFLTGDDVRKCYLGTVKQQPFQFPAKHLWGQGFRPAAGLLPGVLGNSGRRGQLERFFHDGPLGAALPERNSEVCPRCPWRFSRPLC